MSSSENNRLSDQSIFHDQEIQVHMEHDLPYLLLHRYSEENPDPAIRQLMENEPSYLMAKQDQSSKIKSALSPIISKLTNKFGAFLLVEIAEIAHTEDENFAHFEIFGPVKNIEATIETLYEELVNENFSGLVSKVKITPSSDHNEKRNWWPKEELQQLGCLLLVIGISPFYRDQTTGQAFPLVVRSLLSKFPQVLKKGIYKFVKTQTKHEAGSFMSLSSRKVADAVWQIDSALKEIDDHFEFLPLVTPINVPQAWEQFKENKFKKVPAFRYRMLPMDPELEKRTLYNLPLEEIEDPTIAYLFRDKRLELDKMLTMLNERETQNFLWGSIQLYGDISTALLQEARNILKQVGTKPPEKPDNLITAEAFARAAYREFLYLKNQDQRINPVVQVKSTFNGIMVSKGKMLIGTDFTLSESSLNPFLQHEIGTHVLTYYTGTGQPLKILGSGVPGYEELQEGLAVLAEYLVGGLTQARLKILAARVVAVDSLIRDYDFIKTYELMTEEYRIEPEAAFQITMRVYRGGGLSKDAVYLKGLMNLIDYLRSGNDLEVLLCGKIRQDYVPIMQELIARGIANPLQIKPRYLQENESLQRLKDIHQVQDLMQLTK